MRLRLEFLNKDLAERFGFSLIFLFITWIKLLSRILGKVLVVWSPKESIRENFPEIFLKFGYGKCCVIIDYAEVFMSQNHYLFRLLHVQTTSTNVHSIFWLELHPLGLFCPSLPVIRGEQATYLSPEIVGFIIYRKGMMK